MAIAITASHNPPEYNGFKIVHSGLPMAGRDLQDLKSVFDSISEEERVLMAPWLMRLVMLIPLSKR